MNARVLVQPVLHHRMLVGCVVVGDQMQAQRRASRTLAVCDCATLSSLLRSSLSNSIVLATRIADSKKHKIFLGADFHK